MYEVDKSIAEGKELDFYLSFADREDIRVLEPMCGNGRMLIPFMQRGINIEGFDISEDMLKVCREKGNALNLIPQVFFHKIEEFEQLLKSNGFQHIQLHEVKDGYGEGTSFHVFECS
ncbi:class I SAM-dependent methyltransferase [Paenibacillus tundrae]|uniref:class I SAM-dependent methyltransferase n=1 Tax=Paenibacillus tundrae TaxID=528187 RepID=UPI003D3210AC